MQCKFCSFKADQQNLIRHVELYHKRPHHWPCVHSTCVCVFKTQGALKSHLSRFHRKGESDHQSSITFTCEFCDFQELCLEGDIFKHLGSHLKLKETIRCPFFGCEFKTNNYSTFSSHKSRKHTVSDIRTVILCSASNTADITDQSEALPVEDVSSHVSGEETTETLLGRLDDETSNIIGHRRDVALQGLPVFLREDPKELFKECLETDPEEEATKGVAVGILFVLEDCAAAVTSTSVQSIDVILEEAIVLEDIQDLPTALAYLFGLLYVVNISYPKTLKYTFDALQNMFMEIGSDCTQRVRSLKNKLLL